MTRRSMDWPPPSADAWWGLAELPALRESPEGIAFRKVMSADRRRLQAMDRAGLGPEDVGEADLVDVEPEEIGEWDVPAGSSLVGQYEGPVVVETDVGVQAGFLVRDRYGLPWMVRGGNAGDLFPRVRLYALVVVRAHEPANAGPLYTLRTEPKNILGPALSRSPLYPDEPAEPAITAETAAAAEAAAGEGGASWQS